MQFHFDIKIINLYALGAAFLLYRQGLKNALVCSSVTSENVKLSRKFNRAVSVQSVQFNFSHFSFLQLIRN
jgi:hypothetical protein